MTSPAPSLLLSDALPPTRRPRVLLLGWEYAPRLTGGLGTASVRLAHQLAERVDLTVIVPRLPGDEDDEEARAPSFDELAAGDGSDALAPVFPDSSDEHVAPAPVSAASATRPATAYSPAVQPPRPSRPTPARLGEDGEMRGWGDARQVRITGLNRLTPALVRAATAPSAPPRYEVFARVLARVPFALLPYAEQNEVLGMRSKEAGSSAAGVPAGSSAEDLGGEPSPAELAAVVAGSGAHLLLPVSDHRRMNAPDQVQEEVPDSDTSAEELPVALSTAAPTGEVDEEDETASAFPIAQSLNHSITQSSPDPLTAALEPFQRPPALDPLTLPGTNTEVVQFGRLAARMASGEEIDVVYAHDWPTFLAGIEIRLEKRVPLVLHVHSTAWDRHGAPATGAPAGWVFELERQAFRAADRVVAVSHYGARVLREQYGVDEARIRVIHHGLDPAASATAGWEARPVAAEPLVLFVGRLTTQKNPLGFVRIAQRVLDRVPTARFVLAGDGPQRAAVLRAADEAGLAEEQFQVLGFLDDGAVRAQLTEAAVVCLPARSEPFGLAALEAAGVGTPLVLSLTTGATEVLPGALTAAWDDDDALAAHVVHLLTDEPARRRAVRENAAAAHRLTWARAATEVATVLAELVD